MKALFFALVLAYQVYQHPTHHIAPIDGAHLLWEVVERLRRKRQLPVPASLE